MKTYQTFSSAETKILAAVVAEKILKAGPGRMANIVSLRGDLGAGKTTFVQGFLKALGATGRVTSPTFVLMKRFPLKSVAAKKAGFARAYHIDAYRLHEPSEADALGLTKLIEDPAAIVLIEWPERLKGLLPSGKTSIQFKHGKKENERIVRF